MDPAPMDLPAPGEPADAPPVAGAPAQGAPARGAPAAGAPAAGAPAADASLQDAGQDARRNAAGDDEAARVIRGAPGVPHEGARPGQPDQASRQGFGRQRDEPQDQPAAGVLDDQNIAGDKDFELQPPAP